LALLFSNLIVHGTATDDLSFSTMIPIPKGKNNNKTSCNYRAITLSSFFGKLFDYVVLDRYGDLIGTSHLQFGFKKKHSATIYVHVMSMHYSDSNEQLNRFDLVILGFS